MSEHPKYRCPKCGRGAGDVAVNFDPLTWMPDSSCAVQMSCVSGHTWAVFGKNGVAFATAMAGEPGPDWFTKEGA